MSFLYGFQCGPYVKVGISHDIKKRLRQMKLFNPFKVKIVLQRRILTRHARNIEGCVHKFLGECAMGREWFFAPSLVELGRFADISIQAAINVERRNLADYDAATDAPPTRGMDVDSESSHG